MEYTVYIIYKYEKKKDWVTPINITISKEVAKKYVETLNNNKNQRVKEENRPIYTCKPFTLDSDKELVYKL
jgi:hypothetical protein